MLVYRRIRSSRQGGEGSGISRCLGENRKSSLCEDMLVTIGDHARIVAFERFNSKVKAELFRCINIFAGIASSLYKA